MGAFFEHKQLLRLLHTLPKAYVDAYEKYKTANKEYCNTLIKDLIRLSEYDKFALDNFGYPLYAFSDKIYPDVKTMIHGILESYNSAGFSNFYLNAITSEKLFGSLKISKGAKNSLDAFTSYKRNSFGAYEISMYRIVRVDIASYFYKTYGESAFQHFPATTRKDLLNYARSKTD